MHASAPRRVRAGRGPVANVSRKQFSVGRRLSIGLGSQSLCSRSQPPSSWVCMSSDLFRHSFRGSKDSRAHPHCRGSTSSPLGWRRPRHTQRPRLEPVEGRPLALCCRGLTSLLPGWWVTVGVEQPCRAHRLRPEPVEGRPRRHCHGSTSSPLGGGLPLGRATSAFPARESGIGCCNFLGDSDAERQNDPQSDWRSAGARVNWSLGHGQRTRTAQSR
jgi:hypothetical protein